MVAVITNMSCAMKESTRLDAQSCQQYQRCLRRHGQSGSWMILGNHWRVRRFRNGDVKMNQINKGLRVFLAVAPFCLVNKVFRGSESMNMGKITYPLHQIIRHQSLGTKEGVRSSIPNLGPKLLSPSLESILECDVLLFQCECLTLMNCGC